MNEEKRKRERIELATDAMLQVDGARRWFKGACINASLTGVLLSVDRPIPEGRKGRLEVSHNCANEVVDIRARFRVIRATRSRTMPFVYEVGVNITDIDTDSAINLHDVISRELTSKGAYKGRSRQAINS